MPVEGGIDSASMATASTPPCTNCQRLQAEVDSLRAELEALRAVVTQLQRQLAAARKDSSTSSKPPSSDIVKPPKPPPPPGQDRRQPEMLGSHPTDYLWDACPCCGGHLILTADPPIVVQQVDIAAPPLEIHEHRSHPA